MDNFKNVSYRPFQFCKTLNVRTSTNVLNLLQKIKKINKKLKNYPILDPEDYEFIDILFNLIIQKLENTIKVTEKDFFMDLLLNGLSIYRLFNIGWNGSTRRGKSWEKFLKKGSKNSVFIKFGEIWL